MTDICEAEFDSFTELDRLVIIDRRKKCDCISWRPVQYKVVRKAEHRNEVPSGSAILLRIPGYVHCHGA